MREDHATLVTAEYMCAGPLPRSRDQQQDRPFSGRFKLPVINMAVKMHGDDDARTHTETSLSDAPALIMALILRRRHWHYWVF